MAQLVFWTFLAVTWAQSGVHGIFMVVKGDVKITSSIDKKTETAKVGRKVFPGDTVAAGPDSRAKIVMSDKNTLNISPDTQITLEKYENDATRNIRNVQLSVEYGKIRATVEQKYDGEKNRFNIKTPAAVAGVRGTDFLTAYDRSTRQTSITTFSGTVAVGQPGPGGQIVSPVFVKPGEMTRASAGQAPEPPKSVPPTDLAKMQTESNADTASVKTPQEKSETPSKRGSKSEDEGKKEDAKDAGTTGEGKKEDTKGTGATGEGKKDQAQTDGQKSDRSNSSEARVDKDGGRAPASIGPDLGGTNGTGMLTNTDMNGEAVKGFTPVTAPTTISTIPTAGLPSATTPVQNINEVIRTITETTKTGQKSRLHISIQK